MLPVFLIAACICIAGLVLTLVSMNRTDTNYSSERSIKTFSWLYFLLVPIALAFVVLLAFLL
ncbi:MULTISPECIES: hypothetical protein [Shouchella]|uniref:BshB3 potential contributor to bacillithiol synthesis n=2 Tax=Shouchella TaxID=2893057 RepID=A0ABY7W3I5_9BACI|nr:MULTISPECIES: hypothetical protein [Shouchella]MED4127689.1 BshB3 potential contributor to bacillithiol synthesis [Shouchella miscanthi]WDF02626.1 BshB3 potential contributor to bacillithiol synthesis [Shouchella hunanensis]GAF23221.1 hypothetical protein JCM19047_3026 [Bacillus sp. JCM 19047]